MSSKNAHLVTGICEAITCGDQVFLLEGDRHHWTNQIKEEWEQQWHNAPYQVITVKEKLVFLGKEYSNLQQAEYILDYCVKKDWLPKILFNEEEAELVRKHREYGVSAEKLKEFHAMLMYFTEKVKDHHYLELVFGEIDEGPTMDMKIVESTRLREVFEEAGIMTKAEHIGFSDPFTSQRTGLTTVTALYKSHMEIKDMELVWTQVENIRRPTGYEWRCPIPWYKSMPVDKQAGKTEKAMRETCNGKWYPFGIHPRMDKKNKDVISKY